jgi:heterodisulfide reductase subunit C/nitrate reductase gamma subunit
MIGQIIFALLLLVVSAIGFVKYSALIRNIRLGKAEKISGDSGKRLKNMLLVAFGQSKMFKRPVAAILHLFIYVAFLITQIELIEIVLDGILGKHRLFWHLWHENAILSSFYTFIINFIEILSVLALIATFAFLARRNLLKIPRFRKSELSGWPILDANIILFAEVVLVACIFTMNSADMALHKNEYGFAISGLLSGIWGSASNETLEIAERIGWWGHILVVFAFLAYLPFSKHLHILLAFPNTYFARINPKGELANMESIQKEVASMFNPSAETSASTEIPKFGVSDVFDLSRTQLMAAYTCTECGRCTASCPANLTGKKLSPRKVMMDVRDRAEEIGKNIDANKTEFIKADQKDKVSKLSAENYDDGKSLFDYITNEELHACTNCNACVEACPVLINPLDIIMEMRRNLILEQSVSPDSWNAMFNTVENNGAAWAFSSDERDKWTKDLN